MLLLASANYGKPPRSDAPQTHGAKHQHKKEQQHGRESGDVRHDAHRRRGGVVRCVRVVAARNRCSIRDWTAVDGAVTTRITVAALPVESDPSEHTTVAVPEQFP